MKPILAITMGDPAGIGPEIVVQALRSRRLWDACRPVVLGRRPALEAAARRLRAQIVFDPVGTRM
ncbi:MAG TPA: 4-hydroxythreonine-4-phosphate dehydrogenase PdxA, partial [bacterium]